MTRTVHLLVTKQQEPQAFLQTRTLVLPEISQPPQDEGALLHRDQRTLLQVNGWDPSRVAGLWIVTRESERCPEEDGRRLAPRPLKTKCAVPLLEVRLCAPISIGPRRLVSVTYLLELQLGRVELTHNGRDPIESEHDISGAAIATDSSLSDGMRSDSCSSNLSLLILLPRVLEAVCDIVRSVEDGGRDPELILETFPLSPPLLGPELPSRGCPTLIFDNHWNVVIWLERAPAKGPRLIVPGFPLSFTLVATAGTKTGRERGGHCALSSRPASEVFLRPADSRFEKRTGRCGGGALTSARIPRNPIGAERVGGRSLPMGGLLNETFESCRPRFIVVVLVGVRPAFCSRAVRMCFTWWGFDPSPYLYDLRVNRPEPQSLVLRPCYELELRVFYPRISLCAALIQIMFTFSTSSPDKLLHNISVPFELLNRCRRIFMGVHLKCRLTPLRQTQDTLPKRQVSSTPNRVRGVNDRGRLRDVRVPYLDRLV